MKYKQSICTVPFTHTHRQIHVTHAHALKRSRTHTHTRARGTGVNVQERAHSHTESIVWLVVVVVATRQTETKRGEREKSSVGKKTAPTVRRSTDATVRPCVGIRAPGTFRRPLRTARRPGRLPTDAQSRWSRYASVGKCSPPAYRSSVPLSSARCHGVCVHSPAGDAHVQKLRLCTE